MATESQVLDALRPIIDPDFDKSIVDLGFVKNIRIEGDKAIPTKELHWYLEWNFQNAEGAKAKDSWAVDFTLMPGEKVAEGTFRGPIEVKALKYGILDVGAMAPEGAQWEAELQRDGSCLVFLSAPGQTRGNAIYRLEAEE